ncbi:Poly(U)-binding-splicing factor puf60 [Entomortierella chlamydospora]|uniref:Poly(U)-binding-splicing factor puf60 n=1 Tax=Entomortierella chlamydospora TaxID=101097 RepID=A0A9P6N2N0_9FUNG|nr:Poly(U)-binding-splicing factor puf60 [Entomortierella chlamydospora]KAG0022945.1 Poly(U)-binding-splicing factor puf60 [Entomortierella chlamydospora]
MEDPENNNQTLKRSNEEQDLPVESTNGQDNSAKKQRVEKDEAKSEPDNAASKNDTEPENVTMADQDPAAESRDPITGLTSTQTKALELAKQYAREVQEQLLKSGAISSATEPEPSLAIANLVEQRKSLCRVYVGSISFEATEEDVRQKLSRFGDIKELVLKVDPITGKHRGFCFVEYDLPEAAILAVQASESVDVGGRNIKIGRPKNYDAGVINELPPPPEDRIYVANIGSMVSEADLAGIFAAFGEVEKCILIPDPITRKHKGYGYVQFKAGTSIETLVESMKGFMLLDMPMGVCKALIGGTLPEGMKALDHLPAGATTIPAPVRTAPASTPAASVNPAMIAKAQATAASTAQRLVAMGQSSGLNGDRESVASEENMSISGNQRYMVMQSLARSGGLVPPAAAQPEVVVQPTVVRLQYSATPADIDDQLEEEFSEECNARSAAAQLHGRQFDGKTIQASLYDPVEYAAGRLA